MAISSRAVRKKKRIRTLYEVLTDAVNYYVNHGWDMGGVPRLPPEHC
ncbi:hypothetical protein GY539_004429 [Escherichia coli]|nr:hypothetical protein [Escherichia coli]EFI3708071.1 hypothetical protein [Escherichia coli]EFI4435606.1 hypothetical protein [Escherichia coli]EFI5416218.1 hypothetical protein [Escherichia coli]EFI5458514.1 hypothetical protein [Escherichia coli]